MGHRKAGHRKAGHGHALGNRLTPCGAITGISGLPLIDPARAVDSAPGAGRARLALITSTRGLESLDESAVAPSSRLALQLQLGSLVERLALDRDSE